MKKKLPTGAIVNELAASSAFFPKRTQEPQDPIVPTPDSDNQEPEVTKHDPMLPRNHETMTSKRQATTPPTNSGITASTTHDTVTPRHRDTTTPSNHDRPVPTMLETIRRTVKQFGKEAATHRFTKEEKEKIADIIYTYERQGYRTSENEIARIAINWLLWDYEENGVTSVLARLMESLHR